MNTSLSEKRFIIVTKQSRVGLSQVTRCRADGPDAGSVTRPSLLKTPPQKEGITLSERREECLKSEVNEQRSTVMHEVIYLNQGMYLKS